MAGSVKCPEKNIGRKTNMFFSHCGTRMSFITSSIRIVF